VEIVKPVFDALGGQESGRRVGRGQVLARLSRLSAKVSDEMCLEAREGPLSSSAPACIPFVIYVLRIEIYKVQELAGRES
jgi:hypothetical protein